LSETAVKIGGVRQNSALVLGVVLFLIGCASSPSGGRGGKKVGARLTPLQADMAFAQLAMQVPPAEAFSRYTDAKSVELDASGPPIIGRQAIAANLEGMLAGSLEWEPQGGETAKSGDLAWTWGRYVLHGANGDRTGKYMSIWHLRSDGTWLLAADMGSQAPAGK
jgi:ketosteroid isomerase-like protein